MPGGSTRAESAAAAPCLPSAGPAGTRPPAVCTEGMGERLLTCPGIPAGEGFVRGTLALAHAPPLLHAIQKPDRLLQRAWANCSIFWDQAHPLNAASQEAKQGRAASWPGGAPVLQPKRPKSPEQPRTAGKEAGSRCVEWDRSRRGQEGQFVGCSFPSLILLLACSPAERQKFYFILTYTEMFIPFF